MKNILYALGICLLLVNCGKGENEMFLSGNIKGLKTGTVVLQKIDDTILVSLDSVLIDGDSNFSFSEIVSSPEMHYLYLRLENGDLIDERIPFFAEASKISINTTLDGFAKNAIIKGSKNDSLLKIHDKLVQRYIDKNLDLTAKNFEALRDENDTLLAQTKVQQERLLRSKYLATINFAMNQKEFEVAPYLALARIPDANIKYLDTIYKSSSQKIKDSKYGKALESYISERKSEKQ
ncbi:hypothetical protein ULMS_23760 [Patiriisocius marinistellae]|uniref:DUF4369 domain-containing protein n=1 Tax=Patiriisocius marinistellae TaxID=2494560 RepID=A0A5J4FZK6_9FLAO|nr:DUF4369 domain-containing protein [Patiriisocius marinistellae]GEQ86868.1 hypothetical protein ULMS_23760 [Patiriisocius marinistellae]